MALEFRKANIFNTPLKPMKGYEDQYLVSPFGQVYSLKIKKLLKVGRKPNGYLYVRVTKNDIGKNLYIHRLVALHYLDNPENKRCINHKDGLKCNNKLPNLEWCTHKENNHHAWIMGLNPNRLGVLTNQNNN